MDRLKPLKPPSALFLTVGQPRAVQPETQGTESHFPKPLDLTSSWQEIQMLEECGICYFETIATLIQNMVNSTEQMTKFLY